MILIECCQRAATVATKAGKPNSKFESGEPSSPVNSEW